ncbi:MAG TPA: hypothetical protein VFP54_01630 [Acidimicrobiales bacterium]|nr:hypothetical protein [Acidimicrobiales bacterium]
MDPNGYETAVGRGMGRGKLNRLLLKVFGPASVGVPTPRPAPTVPDDGERTSKDPRTD